jgi:hypothetical protein
MEFYIPRTKKELTPELKKFNEKRRWQIALRRYVLKKTAAAVYAPYFGIDINGFREWIELQFTPNLHWENFGKAWQFDHIVPTTYFDFENTEDLMLCWNFVNIRVEKLHLNKARGNRIDVLAVKPYFEDLYNRTGYVYCLKMIKKLTIIEVSNIESHPAIESFLINNKERLESIATLSVHEFEKFNHGVLIKDIFLEREILKKFGS